MIDLKVLKDVADTTWSRTSHDDIRMEVVKIHALIAIAERLDALMVKGTVAKITAKLPREA